MPRMVQCVKLGREAEGLEKPPYKNELGQRIYEHVSKEAWGVWLEHMKILLNEYRLIPTDPQARAFLLKTCEQFFFGEAPKMPEQFVDPEEKK